MLNLLRSLVNSSTSGHMGENPEDYCTVRCFSLDSLEDTTKITEDLRMGNIVIFSLKTLRMSNPVEAKRALHQTNAVVREIGGSLSRLGKDYVIALPATHKFVVPAGR